MEATLKHIANNLAKAGKTVEFGANSVLEAYNLERNEESLKELTKAIATKINNNIILYRTKMKPLWNEVEALLKENIAAMQSKSDLNRYNIVAHDIPAVITALIEQGEVNKNKQESKAVLNMKNVSIPLPSKLDVYKAFSHPLATINTFALDVIEKYSDDDLLKLWEKAFTNLSESNSYLASLANDPVLNIEEIVLLFLAASGLQKKKPLNYTMKDEVYYEAVNNIKIALGDLITEAYHTLNLYRKADRLVLGKRDDNYTLIVDELVYRKFLDAGLASDVLLGYLASNPEGTSSYLLSNIQAKANEYQESWTSKVKLENYNTIIRKSFNYRAVYSIIAEKIVDLVPQDLIELLACDDKQENIKAIEKLANVADDETILDISKMAYDILTKVFFPDSGFEQFGAYMLKYSELDENVTSEDAAVYASLELSVDYLLNQINLEGNNGVDSNR